MTTPYVPCSHVLMVTNDAIATCGHAAERKAGRAPLCSQHDDHERKGEVYVIVWGKYAKIGQSVNPELRLRSIRGGTDGTKRPDDVTGVPTIIGTAPGGLHMEGWLHTVLAKYRTVGEWFRREGPVEELVKHISTGRQVSTISAVLSLVDATQPPAVDF